jgi:hypothetical protein
VPADTLWKTQVEEISENSKGLAKEKDEKAQREKMKIEARGFANIDQQTGQHVGCVLAGEAYVEGIMHGEAEASARFERLGVV